MTCATSVSALAPSPTKVDPCIAAKVFRLEPRQPLQRRFCVGRIRHIVRQRALLIFD